MNGILVDKNLIAVKRSDIIKHLEGEEFEVVVDKVKYLCRLDSKKHITQGFSLDSKKYVTRGFSFLQVRISCVSHPYMKVTEYSSM